MLQYSTRQAAKKLGLTQAALSRYLKSGKVPAPKMVTSGFMTLHLWTEQEIERIAKLLPKIKNGRKTRNQKKRLAVSTQQSAKPKKQKPPPKAAVPHTPRQKK
jgi:predicted transcriptional regulator